MKLRTDWKTTNVRQQQFTVGEQLRRLLRLIAKMTAEEMKNRVEFLGALG
jgi:hypothetical protein